MFVRQPLAQTFLLEVNSQTHSAARTALTVKSRYARLLLPAVAVMWFTSKARVRALACREFPDPTDRPAFRDGYATVGCL